MDVKKCTVCNIMIDEDNCKKDRNICKNCYNINRKKYTINEKKKKLMTLRNIEKPKIDKVNNDVSTYENHRHVIIGLSNVGKTYYTLKILEKIGNKRPIHKKPDHPIIIQIKKQVTKINQ